MTQMLSEIAEEEPEIKPLNSNDKVAPVKNVTPVKKKILGLSPKAVLMQVYSTKKKC